MTTSSILMLTADMFRPYVGHPWLVDTQPKPVTIHLSAVDTLGGSNSGFRDPFVLVFTTPWDTLLVEGEYLMRPHDGAEAVKIHLIPTQGPHGGDRPYQAVFN